MLGSQPVKLPMVQLPLLGVPWAACVSSICLAMTSSLWCAVLSAGCSPLPVCRRYTSLDVYSHSWPKYTNSELSGHYTSKCVDPKPTTSPAHHAPAFGSCLPRTRSPQDRKGSCQQPKNCLQTPGAKDCTPEIDTSEIIVDVQ